MKIAILLTVLFLGVIAKPSGPTVKCALCSLAVNSVEGFIAETKTENEIIILANQFCHSLEDGPKELCLDIVGFIPDIIAAVERHESVAAICKGLKLCETYPGPVPDPEEIGHYQINLDLKPEDRWKALYSIPKYKSAIVDLYETAVAALPKRVVEILEDLGNDVVNYFPYPFGDEIRGGAEALGIPVGMLGIANIGYEISNACTSIVAESVDGKIHHARNMDFGFGMDFTTVLRDIAVEVDYVSKNRTIYHTVTFVGYVGVLTGMKPNGFSITVNTRFVQGPMWNIFYNLIDAITVKNASVNSQLIRNVLLNTNSFDEALNTFSNHPLIANVYFTLAGTKSGEGAIISRNRINATDVWRLNAPSTWYILETNYDHWEPPPWYDDRRTPANNAMKAMGRSALSFAGLLEVLTVKPVLNLQTAYTALISADQNVFRTYKRYCNDPCPS